MTVGPKRGGLVWIERVNGKGVAANVNNRLRTAKNKRRAARLANGGDGAGGGRCVVTARGRCPRCAAGLLMPTVRREEGGHLRGLQVRMRARPLRRLIGE